MRISAQAEIIADALQKLLEDDKGKAVVCNDIEHMWEVAYQSTATPRALICCVGEQLRGDFSVAAALGRVDRQWIVAIIRGTGFPATRGDGLTKTIQNARPFYDQVEDARDAIRCLRNISVELPVDMRGIRPMEKLDDFMSGYLIEFSTAIDLPEMVVETPTLYFESLPQSYTATCPEGESGDPVTVTTIQGQFTSLNSQEEADAAALAYATETAEAQIVCFAPVDYGTVTPGILAGTPIHYFGGGAVLPEGTYECLYEEGALDYSINPPTAWTVNLAASPLSGYRVIHSTATTIEGPVNGYDTFSLQASLEAYQEGASITFEHDGTSAIGMFLFDDNYPDNVAGTPKPTFRLRRIA